jgi:hypothetical protein
MSLETPYTLVIEAGSLNGYPFLGEVANLPSEPGVPYSVLVFSGTLIWGFFAQCFGGASGNLPCSVPRGC